MSHLIENPEDRFSHDDADHVFGDTYLFSTRPMGYKAFFMLNSIQLSMEFILLINVKMPTIFGISIFISRINNWLL